MLKSPLLRQDTGGVIVAPAVRLAAGCTDARTRIVRPDLLRALRYQPLAHDALQILKTGAVIPDGLRGGGDRLRSINDGPLGDQSQFHRLRSSHGSPAFRHGNPSV